MPMYHIPQYFVIFDAQFPLGFALLFPFLDDWLLLAPFSHHVTSRQGRSPDLGYVDFRMTKH
jgi:hypothetical protein